MSKDIILTEKDIARFWSKVDIRGIDECWEWRAALFDSGYGAFQTRDKTYRAHRVAWVIENKRQIKEGYIVAHTPIVCHNRKCCNPNHLREATTKDNSTDREMDGTVARGDRHFSKRNPELVVRGDRHGLRLHPERAARGERNGWSRFTENQIMEIRQMYSSGIKQTIIANLFGTRQGTISNIVLRRSWRHI